MNEQMLFLTYYYFNVSESKAILADKYLLHIYRRPCLNNPQPISESKEVKIVSVLVNHFHFSHLLKLEEKNLSELRTP